MQQLTISAGAVTVIVDAPLQFTPNNAIPHPVVGQAFTPTSVGTVSGGTAPYAFSNATGLPPGMTLSAAGLLQGTPTSAGTFASLAFTINDSAP